MVAQNVRHCLTACVYQMPQIICLTFGILCTEYIRRLLFSLIMQNKVASSCECFKDVSSQRGLGTLLRYCFMLTCIICRVIQRSIYTPACKSPGAASATSYAVVVA